MFKTNPIGSIIENDGLLVDIHSCLKMLRRQRDYQFFSLRGALHEQMVSCTSNEQMLHVQRKDAARAMSSPCTCRDKTLHVQLF